MTSHPHPWASPRISALAAGLVLAALTPLRADSVSFGSGPGQGGLSFRFPEQGSPDLAAAARWFREGDPDQARRALEAAVAKDPALPPALALMATLHFSADQVPQGRLLLEQAAAEDPDHPEIYLLFGKLALAEGRLTDAQLAFEKAAGLGPPPSWTDAQGRNRSLTCREGLAAVAEARGDWRGARSHLEAWLALEPSDGLARQRLGFALFHLGEVRQAYEALTRATADRPALEAPAVSIARLYTQAGDPIEAEPWIDAAVRLEPESPRAHLARAGWLLEQGRAREVAPHVDALARLAPDSADLRRLRGVTARHLGRHAEAEADFQALVRESPDDLIASNHLALALAEQGEAKRLQALALAEANVRRHPDDPELLATYGWVLFRLGRAEEAEQALRAAASRGRISSDVAFDLGRVLDARGAADDAEALIRLAIETPGPFIGRDEARTLLERRSRAP